MRQFHLKKINQFLKEQAEAETKANEQHKASQSDKIVGPNVSPSSTYNFKK